MITSSPLLIPRRAEAHKLNILIALEFVRGAGQGSKSSCTFVLETIGAGVAGIVQPTLGFVRTSVVGGLEEELIPPYLNCVLEYKMLPHVECDPHQILNKFMLGVSTGPLHHCLLDGLVSELLTAHVEQVNLHQLDFVWVEGYRPIGTCF